MNNCRGVTPARILFFFLTKSTLGIPALETTYSSTKYEYILSFYIGRGPRRTDSSYPTRPSPVDGDKRGAVCGDETVQREAKQNNGGENEDGKGRAAPHATIMLTAIHQQYNEPGSTPIPPPAACVPRPPAVVVRRQSVLFALRQPNHRNAKRVRLVRLMGLARSLSTGIGIQQLLTLRVASCVVHKPTAIISSLTNKRDACPTLNQ